MSEIQTHGAQTKEWPGGLKKGEGILQSIELFVFVVMCAV